MISKLFDYDPKTQKETWHHYDPSTDKVTLEVKQVIDHIAEENWEERKSYDSFARFGEMRKVASIPLNVYFELKRKGIIDDPKEFAKWLNKSENAVFRTFPKSI